MKSTLLLPLLLIGLFAFSQNTAFKMPAEIKFDKTVVQKINDKKDGILTYYFTANGDYAAMKPDNKDGALIIYTKEGNMLIVSEKQKSIVVMNMKGFINSAVAKQMNKENAHKDSSSAKGSFRKTGNTKTIAGYPAEEYEVTSEQGKMKIWYAKVDFDSALALSMGMAKGPGMKSQLPGTDLQDIPGVGKNLFMAEMEKNDKKVIETISISKSDYNFSSAGYTVQDMSSMLKGNYNQ